MMGLQLVVGASGFIGNKLYKYLKGKELNVKGTYCSGIFEGAERDGFYLNLNHPPSSQVLGLNNLTHIYLCHGITDIDQCKMNHSLAYTINVANTINLLGNYVNTGVIPIYLSTDMVYDGKQKDFVETDATHPITRYGKQKVEVENYIMAQFNEYIILRLTKVYGVEMGDGTLFTSWLDSLMSHKAIFSADDIFISPVYVMDVVCTLDRLVTGKHYGIFNLGGNQVATRYDLSQRLARYFKYDLSLVKSRSINDFNFKEPRPLYSSLNSAKIKKVIEPELASIDDCFWLMQGWCK